VIANDHRSLSRPAGDPRRQKTADLGDPENWFQAGPPSSAAGSGSGRQSAFFDRPPGGRNSSGRVTSSCRAHCAQGRFNRAQPRKVRPRELMQGRVTSALLQGHINNFGTGFGRKPGLPTAQPCNKQGENFSQAALPGQAAGTCTVFKRPPTPGNCGWSCAGARRQGDETADCTWSAQGPSPLGTRKSGRHLGGIRHEELRDRASGQADLAFPGLFAGTAPRFRRGRTPRGKTAAGHVLRPARTTRSSSHNPGHGKTVWAQWADLPVREQAC